jgi:hypothetical protein
MSAECVEEKKLYAHVPLLVPLRPALLFALDMEALSRGFEGMTSEKRQSEGVILGRTYGLTTDTTQYHKGNDCVCDVCCVH